MVEPFLLYIILKERRKRMKVILMSNKAKREEMKKRLPINDPKYIAFKRLKGILGEIDPAKMREERADEITTRYQCCS